MPRPVILSADSTCDIGPVIKERYHVNFFHYHIQVGDKTYVDQVEISPEQIYAAWREKGLLPKTAAITPLEYVDYFRPFVEQGYDVLHLSLGSALTSSYQNCLLAARTTGHVYPVDSASLSTGSGHLVVRAGQMVQSGMSAPDIAARLESLREKVCASFVLDTLEFMVAGGRCSALMAFGANLLKLKPSIRVDSFGCGRMDVGKKYRGSMEKAVKEYIRDQLNARTDLDEELIFITHSTVPSGLTELARKEIARYAGFKEVVETVASGTISAHCGPGTLGILFMTK